MTPLPLSCRYWLTLDRRIKATARLLASLTKERDKLSAFEPYRGNLRTIKRRVAKLDDPDPVEDAFNAWLDSQIEDPSAGVWTTNDADALRAAWLDGRQQGIIETHKVLNPNQQTP